MSFPINTQITLYKNVELDRNYNHTYRFNNPTEQRNFFNTKYEKFTGIPPHTFQRITAGFIQVGFFIETIRPYNYMRIVDSNVNKEYYCFIDSVEYVSPSCTTINYTVDVMQSYMFDYDFADCFIEREHSATDEIGDNIIAENFKATPNIVNAHDDFNPCGEPSDERPLFVTAIYYTPNKTEDGYSVLKGYHTIVENNELLMDIIWETGFDNVGFQSNGVYYPFNCFVIETETGTYRNEIPSNSQGYLIDYHDEIYRRIISSMQANNANIIKIAMSPYRMYGLYKINEGESITSLSLGYTYFNFSLNNTYSGNGYTYTPKNKKLYCSPYNIVTLSNNLGQTKELQWEHFDTPNLATFAVEFTPHPLPELVIYPLRYFNNDKYYNLALSITDFPQPPWSLDSYTAWWQTHHNTYTTSLTGTALSTLTSGLIAGFTGRLPAVGASIVSGVTSVANTIATEKDMVNALDDTKGLSYDSFIRIAQQRVGFTIFQLSIPAEQAEVIDNYFTMYGYATNLVKKPNVFSGTRRPFFNYLKTQGAIIHPTGTGMPHDVEELICSVYDKGITFWEQTTQIGEYNSYDNSPV